jgi:hypothetical protein
MADVHVVQVTADNQTEVASKLLALLRDNDIDSAALENIEITPFGDNLFLIEVTYG